MARNLFDHIKGVTKEKVKWESLQDEDKKTWSNFIISRWFSMEMELVQTINYFQQFSNGILTSKDYYKLLHDFLPKTSFYLKYTKKRSKIELEQKFVELFCSHFQLGKQNIYEYISLLKKVNPEELTNILKSYGTREEDIKLFEKQLKNIP